MSRYDRYFLQHILWLNDGFCQYYVQDPTWSRKDILDAPCVIFDLRNEAEAFLDQCLRTERNTTLMRLRTFLATECLERLQVHLMNDQQVVAAAARQFTTRVHKIVVEPKYGWAVQMSATTATAEPLIPVRVEPEPDVDHLIRQFKAMLDTLVAEQQKSYQNHEARLAQMSRTQKAGAYAQKAADGLYEGTIGSVISLVKLAATFYIGYWKTLWGMANYPRRAARLTLQAMAQADTSPLHQEIDRIVAPIATSYEQAVQYKAMLRILFSDPEITEILYDFANRYWQATHSLDRTELGAEALADVVLALLVLLLTAGVGVAATATAKSARFARAGELLHKILAVLKRVGPRQNLSSRSKSGSAPRSKSMAEPDTSAKKKSSDKSELIDKDARTSLHAPPANLVEAVDRLKLARQRLVREGYKPKYTDDQLKAIAAKGDVNDRFVVRFFEAKYAEDMSGHLGPKTNGKVRYWSTTFDQIENADTDPKRIAECMGLDYDPGKTYKLAVIDNADAAKYADSHIIIPTHKNLGAFARSELTDLPGDKLQKILNDDYAKEYVNAIKVAESKGFNIRDDIELKNFSKTCIQGSEARELFEMRAKIHTELGANEYFTGNGLTAYIGKESPNAFGVVETFTFDKNPKTIGTMIADGRLKMLDANPVQ
jgi:hypothetical protein